MANPIYSFVDTKTNLRYFQIWDTCTELPRTVPMNLLIFLQYWGIDDEQKIEALYSFYPQLIRTGTTLNSWDFEHVRLDLKLLSLNYLDLKIDIQSEDENLLIKQLELLFAKDLTFFDFYFEYSQIINPINNFPRRPTNFYRSWSHTMNCLDFKDERIFSLTKEVTMLFNIPQDLLCSNETEYDLHKWLRGNIFLEYQVAMESLFLLLGENNFIALDAIPHIIRNNDNFKRLYSSFGMDNFVINTIIQYDLFDTNSRKWVLFNGEKQIRQFANLITFESTEQELKGIRLLEMSHSEIQVLLYDLCVLSDNLVNLQDKYGNLHLPMKYISFFGLDQFTCFFVFAPFGRQYFEVFDQRGMLVDEGDYYDFYFISDHIGYFQNSDILSWIRWFYNEKTKTIDKIPVSVDNPFDENEWLRVEKVYQNNLQNVEVNQLEEQVDLLELMFYEGNKMHSLYLSLTQITSATNIVLALSNHFKSLFFNGVSLDVQFETGIELYRALISNNRTISFDHGILNLFQVTYDSENVKTNFKPNYKNVNLNDDVVTNCIRSSISFHCIKIERVIDGQQSTFQAFFTVSNHSEEFKIDCEGFIANNLLENETNIEKYGLSYVDYLLGKGYSQAKVFTQLLDVDSIKSLPGIELNEYGNFVQPDRSELNLEDDDLPF
jgi:hypothetical protein